MSWGGGVRVCPCRTSKVDPSGVRGIRGIEVDTQGDAAFVAFPDAQAAASAAQTLTESLAFGPDEGSGAGLHSGTLLTTSGG